jgi:hypothetical protein
METAVEIAEWVHTDISTTFVTANQPLTGPQFAAITNMNNLRIEFTADAYEAETLAWESAVVGDGGSVSAGRLSLVNTLIAGLKTDGIWTKLDRLWLFAAENSQSALRDLVAASAATAVNSPTFAADDGFTGDGATSYVDTNYNPTVSGTNYVLDSAHIGVWNNTVDTTDTSCTVGAVGGSFNEIFIVYGNEGNKTAITINNGGPTFTLTTVVEVSTGFWQANRSGASATQIYRNGASVGSGTVASSQLCNAEFYACALNNDGTPALFSVNQVAAASFGGSLNTTESDALYDRLQTYMTAVGL